MVFSYFLIASFLLLWYFGVFVHVCLSTGHGTVVVVVTLFPYSSLKQATSVHLGPTQCTAGQNVAPASHSQLVMGKTCFLAVEFPQQASMTQVEDRGLHFSSSTVVQYAMQRYLVKQDTRYATETQI